MPIITRFWQKKKIRRAENVKPRLFWRGFIAVSLYLIPVQLRPVGQELVADLPQGGFIGLAGGIGDADDVEACVVCGAGGVEGIFTAVSYTHLTLPTKLEV